MIDYVCRHWNEADAGIWEVRGPPSHHLHWRLMCWVALDRAIRLVSKRSLAAPFTRCGRRVLGVFVLVWECLARAGRMDETRRIFEKLLRYADHLQLYAEEFDERAKLIGNFLQGYTHLALVSAD